MRQTKTIFYSALMLTGVNLLLRIAGTSFHVYLSRKIGASGLGLLQLVMSVGNLAMVTAIAGIRTATMYLTAEEIGKSRPQNIACVLSGCFQYSIIFSGISSLVLYFAAPILAKHWIGNAQTIPALRTFAAFLPIVCLCGVLSGYFTAEKKIGTLAAVEVIEQVFSMSVTLITLVFWAGSDSQKSCLAVILGSSLGACLTFSLLILLRVREKQYPLSHIPVKKRILMSALPLAAADVIRSGIGTTENLLVPKRLRFYAGESDPLSAFGRVSGMVFPLMMFPACILYALTELLIPELAGCKASGNTVRIRYLVKRSLWAAMVYGVFFSGLIYLFAVPLCSTLYKNPAAGLSLKSYSLLIPFLYCDAVTDAMTKGLGQQKICVRYNILTSAMDVCFLFFLLPRYGMRGYFVSFLVTHLLNFALSLRRLLLITHCRIPFYVPAFSVAAGILATWFSSAVHIQLLYPPLLFLFLRITGVLQEEDFRWMLTLIMGRRSTSNTFSGLKTPEKNQG